MAKLLFTVHFCIGLLEIALACDSNTCKLPNCFCPGTRGPPSIPRDDIPQMVMLTFDDAVLKEHQVSFENIFTKDRTNPNGCPILATFFVCHNWTEYNIVKELYQQGHELASHSKTHRMPQSFWTYASYGDWESELEGQRDNINKLAGVPRSEIKGARAPYLETGGDAQFQMMTDAGYTYDSSFMTGPFVEGGVWPFTLHYPPSTVYCSNINCPKRSYPNLWEIPLNRWVAPDGRPCPMMDACDRQPKDKDDAKAFFLKNFNRHYRGNRAPFGMHLHAPWFAEGGGYKLHAFAEFLDEVLSNDDVYFVTLQQVKSWMVNPQPKHLVSQFKPWKNCQDHPTSMDTSATKSVHVIRPSTTTTTKATTRKQPTRTRQRLPYFTRPKPSTTLLPVQFPKPTITPVIEKSTNRVTTPMRRTTLKTTYSKSENAQQVKTSSSSTDLHVARTFLATVIMVIVILM